MTGGSQQLRIFRRAIRSGATLEEACAATGNTIEPAEGRIYLEMDRKNPPPEEAYRMLYDPEARKEDDMTRGKKADDELENGSISGEYNTPDASKAFQIYDDHIAPKLAAMATLRGDCAEPWQNIKKLAHFPRPVMNFVIGLDNIDDDAKRDHYLLALHEALRIRGHALPADIATLADGSAGGAVVPIGGRNAPFLAAITTDDDDEQFEATQGELDQQQGRPDRSGDADGDPDDLEAAE